MAPRRNGTPPPGAHEVDTMIQTARSALLTAFFLAVALCSIVPAQLAAAPKGQMNFAAHVTLAPRWLDPAETESAITPFMVLYAIHDAMLKPMPGGLTTPSLAESWTVSKDGLAYEFLVRNGVKFHNGDPVTPDDVKFSYERYRGGAAKLLKDRVREVQVVDARRVRFVLKEAWREELLHQIQRILHDRVVFAPIWENGLIRGVGSRAEEPALSLIPAFP
jgi:ABC-type transport system substrate-binding protein